MKKHFCKLLICFFLITAVLIAGSPAIAADGTALYKSAADLAGKRIGVLKGGVFDSYAAEYIADCQLLYYDNSWEGAAALDNGYVDAYIVDEPEVRILLAAHENQAVIQELEKTDYAIMLQKDNEASALLCEEFNDFLRLSRRNGLLDYLQVKWTGKYEDAKTVDLSQVRSGVNGTLTLGTATDIFTSFAYLKDGAFVGYEIELVAEFCKAYGYGLRIEDYPFSDLMNVLHTGQVDLAAACLTVTEERQQDFLFTDPCYEGGVILIGMQAERADMISIDDLKGATVGILNGSVYDITAEKTIEDCVLSYYNNFADMATATDEGKIDCYIADEPIAKYIISSHPSQKIVCRLTEDSYAMAFPKNDTKAEELCKKINAFLRKSEENGFLMELENRWLYGREEKRVCDYSDVEAGGVNGTLVFGCSSDVGAPFCYYKEGKLVGYEMELVAAFCREYGYGLELKNYAFSGLINAIAAGSVDFGGSGIIVTDERSENLLFADAYYTGGQMLVMMDQTSSVYAGSLSDSMVASFERTFLREDRWRLFLSGIWTTTVITVSSLFFGAILGFLLFLICRRGNQLLNRIMSFCMMIIQRMPVIVLLMILFYVVFGKLLPNGLAVSVICFTLTFAAAFFGLVKAGVGAVDRSQYEAAYSLGFNETGAFFHVVLPQAARHFLPLLRAEVITHIKATAVVGYIAVSDLTRVGDIVRSRTYEAFFPLIATAVIYFALEALLVLLVSRIELRADLRKRKPEDILKGVDEE